MQRLDKLISTYTTLSRRDATAVIRRGKVAVDGVVIKDPAAKADEQAVITLDGEAVICRLHTYIIMNKPIGVVCATTDREEQTVCDILPEEYRKSGLFPAGRLDKDTTGLVIITDDGDFAHRMLAPKKHVAKTYLATLDIPADDTVTAAFRDGITLKNGEVCRSAVCEPLDGTSVRVILHEGKYHQVKRMFAACGRHVETLHRESVGGLSLDPSLAPGECRLLTETEAMTVFL